jgi:Ca2+-transporting ATPase
MKKISLETLRNLGKREGGLTEGEAAIQISRYGPNEIVEVAENPWLEIIKDTLKDPMIWFLVGIGVVFTIVGDTNEAIILFIAILPLTLMDAFLHWRTQASTSGLKSQLTSHIRVIRSSKEYDLDSRQLVPGDLIIISPGIFLPADGIFQSTSGLQIDESVLTGEAFPIQKLSSPFDPFVRAEAGEVSVNPNILGYAGTRALTGHGRLRIVLTGGRTSYGEIVQSAARMPHEHTPLQKSIAKLVKILVAASGIFCLVLAGLRIYQGHGWLDALLSAATLAVAAIPEEFPVVFTFFLGVGVYRLAKKHALVRRAVSVENIGRVTQICTDKTGTITIGSLRLTHIDPSDDQNELTVLSAGLAASNPDGSDPIDLAIQEVSRQKGLVNHPRLLVFPFTEDRKQETAIFVDSDDQLTAFMKGAPETVIAKSNLSEDERKAWISKTASWAREGHKVLACAKKPINQKEVDDGREPQSGFQFCGLLAFEDPPRKEVAEAIRYCKQNHIGVLMLTGDHIETATAIAKDIGLGGGSPAAVSAEAEPDKFEEAWLNNNPEFLRGLNLVARCTPIQKLRIVNAFKNTGELVVVTGDGVNDVPALKAADIGIAMGARGTRSAKEVSSIVLSDDNFSTIVNAIMEGRQLFSNLKMSFEYLLLIHIPLVLTAALIPLFGYPLLYLPVHIVWLELMIHPTALLAFQEKASPTVKTAVNRNNFFSSIDFARIALIGLGLSLAIGLTFLSSLRENADIGHARGVTMAMLTCWSAGLVLFFTRFRRGTSLFLATSTILFSVLLLQASTLSTFLHTSPLHPKDWITTFGVVLVLLSCLSVGRFFQLKKSCEPVPDQFSSKPYKSVSNEPDAL